MSRGSLGHQTERHSTLSAAMDDPAEKFRTRVREQYNFEPEIQEFESGSTPTAAKAATALGCPVDQVVASIVCTVDDAVVLALTSGANQVDFEALARIHGGSTASLAAPETVREVTGYPVGGVPPLGHDQELPTYMDESLCAFETIYPAGGSAERLFSIDPDRLIDLADATVAGIGTPK